MTALTDLRALALIDPHHGSLSELSDRWIERNSAEVLISRRKGKPRAASVIVREACPADRSVDFMVKFWLVDTTQSPKEIHDSLAANVRLMLAEATRRGATKAWAFVPFKGRHLGTFLDRMDAAGEGGWVNIDGRAAEYGRLFIATFAGSTEFIK